jgi:hypothetical protein
LGAIGFASATHRNKPVVLDVPAPGLKPAIYTRGMPPQAAEAGKLWEAMQLQADEVGKLREAMQLPATALGNCMRKAWRAV